MEGVPTTAGVPDYKDFRPTKNATASIVYYARAPSLQAKPMSP
jgi:hypothetical protein